MPLSSNKSRHRLIAKSRNDDPKSEAWTRAEETGFINKLSKFVTNSPLNKAEIWLAKQQAGDYDEAEIIEFIQDQIDENKVVVFSFSTCPFCVKSKEALDILGVKFSAVEVDQMGIQGLAIRAELAQATGRTSMPNIFVKGVPIGGCNDGSPGLMPLIESGQLADLLAAVDDSPQPSMLSKMTAGLGKALKSFKYTNNDSV